MKCKITSPFRFNNYVYALNLENYNWVFRKKGKDYQRFFNQYGMTEITYEDFNHLRYCGFKEEKFDKKSNKELVDTHINFYTENHSSEDKWSLQKSRGYAQKIFSDDIKGYLFK